MAKAVGLLLLFSCGTMAGWLRANALGNRAKRIQELCDFLRQFQAQLEGTRGTPGEIVRRLARQTAFAENSLIQTLTQGFGQRSSFGENMTTAVAGCPWLGNNSGIGSILISLGDDIGIKDLGSQLTALVAAELLLEQEAARAKEQYEKYGGLSQRLGILLGLLAVVILA